MNLFPSEGKHYFYAPVWLKYIPVLRILIKKSAVEEQVFQFNRGDFEKAGYARKSGFTSNLSISNNRPDRFSENELLKTFVLVLQEDKIIRDLFLINGYSFTFSGQFKLRIKNNGQS